MNAEYLEVVQNFAVDGPNRGLICVVADTVKPAPPVVPASCLPRYHWQKPTIVKAVIAALAQDPCTQQELREGLDLTGPQVRTALHVLRRQGRLVSDRGAARGAQVYRLTDTAQHEKARA